MSVTFFPTHAFSSSARRIGRAHADAPLGVSGKLEVESGAVGVHARTAVATSAESQRRPRRIATFRTGAL